MKDLLLSYEIKQRDYCNAVDFTFTINSNIEINEVLYIDIQKLVECYKDLRSCKDFSITIKFSDWVLCYPEFNINEYKNLIIKLRRINDTENKIKFEWNVRYRENIKPEDITEFNVINLNPYNNINIKQNSETLLEKIDELIELVKTAREDSKRKTIQLNHIISKLNG